MDNAELAFRIIMRIESICKDMYQAPSKDVARHVHRLRLVLIVLDCMASKIFFGWRGRYDRSVCSGSSSSGASGVGNRAGAPASALDAPGPPPPPPPTPPTPTHRPGRPGIGFAETRAYGEGSEDNGGGGSA
jgi:hypothetical protein